MGSLFPLRRSHICLLCTAFLVNGHTWYLFYAFLLSRCNALDGKELIRQCLEKGVVDSLNANLDVVSTFIVKVEED